MKHLKINLKKIGEHPGNVYYTGEKESRPGTLEMITYGADAYERDPVTDIDALQSDQGKVRWIRMVGVQDTDMVQRIGGHFDIDPLVLEDITHVGIRSKIDLYDTYTFLVFDTVYSDSEHNLAQEQISILHIGDIIVTFQETESGFFDPIIERIAADKGTIRRHGADYLLYCLIDLIVDKQFVLLNDFEETMDRLEMDIIHDTRKEQAQMIYVLKRDLLVIKNSLWPMRDIVSTLINDAEVDHAMHRHYRDIEDHIKQIMDFTTTYRELIMGMYETYLSNISNRMNRIITTLTVFSVIFIPLTFLAGVYGMNFKYFPELAWRWAYPVFWGVCALIGAGMFLFFKKKKWM